MNYSNGGFLKFSKRNPLTAKVAKALRFAQRTQRRYAIWDARYLVRMDAI